MTLAIGSEIGGRYRLTKKLAVGSYGEVYEADDLNLDRRVAIKVHRSDTDMELARFNRESAIMAKLRHPHIVQVHAVLEHDDVHLIVMDLVEGQTLRKHLKSHGRLDTLSALRVATQVCDAVSCAHSNGVVHRDLKPDNIVLSRDHRGDLFAMVLDFGLAKSADTMTAAPPLTARGTIMGTAKYIAPELVMGEQASPASDVYAIGLMTLQSLTGQPVFDGKTLFHVLAKHVHAPVRIPNALVDTALGEFIVKATQKQPETRHENAELAFAALRSIQIDNFLVSDDEIPEADHRIYVIEIGPIAGNEEPLVNVAPVRVGTIPGSVVSDDDGLPTAKVEAPKLDEISMPKTVEISYPEFDQTDVDDEEPTS